VGKTRNLKFQVDMVLLNTNYKSTILIIHTVLTSKKQVRLIPQFTGRKPKNHYNIPNTFTIASFYYNIFPLNKERNDACLV